MDFLRVLLEFLSDAEKVFPDFPQMPSIVAMAQLIYFYSAVVS